ncbi:MAG: carboxypeptidase-like regulatory domain-containing protein, partial [Armatimonadetes bacterium]|nr:carboxypeptidase-like regulatory domain-containing protein [Armatimonadota bacterium]
AWSDEFNDGVLDQTAPEPDWSTYTASGGSIQETGGYLRLAGTSGSNSAAGVYNGKYLLYDNFIINTKLYLANTTATVSGESNAEIRFRANTSGVGYSLSFKAKDSPNVINLRRSDTWAIIQSKQVTYNLPSGTVLYVRIECKGTRIKVKVGTVEGGSDVVNWDFTDSTFSGKGCFWLFNYHMMDCRFDYFRYEPVPTGMEGTVRDTLGNPVGGATVTTNPGGYTATTNADGTYRIVEMTPGTYSATASKANYTPQTVNGISVSQDNMTVQDFTITDATPPTTPTVMDDGAYQTSSTTFHVWWTPSSDPESGILEYRYAISASPSSLDIIPGGEWLTVGLAREHTRTGLSLENGQTYYALVRARSNTLKPSDIGVSDGIKIAQAVSSIAEAKGRPDGTMVALDDRIVTASFGDCIYIEDPDRTSGIKVTATGIAEGAVVDLAGTLSTSGVERQISGYSVTQVGSTTVPKPVALTNMFVGGSSLNNYTPGITGAIGVHNIGLLVTTWGKVTGTGSGYFTISDGSSAGLKVVVPPGISIPAQDKYVVVTGISSSEGSTTRVLRVRKQADVVVY